MGGHVTLKLAFHDPTLFAAIAAMEPGIDAAIHPSEINERNYYFSCRFCLDERKWI